MVRGKSIWQMRAGLVPGVMLPGQETMKGTRVPPSKSEYLPPRQGWADWWLAQASRAPSS